ncbi:MAG: hypothetical protein NXH86_04030 [Flavobacteriaceae bacterium]|nr:hypothetical protein [Flavobacteriaceae bacterium]
MSMKKILLMLVLLAPLIGISQGGPKVDVIKFRGEVTTTIRDTFDVPSGETWLVFNVTTSRLEYAGSDDVWIEVNSNSEITPQLTIKDDGVGSEQTGIGFENSSGTTRFSMGYSGSTFSAYLTNSTSGTSLTIPDGGDPRFNEILRADGFRFTDGGLATEILLSNGLHTDLIDDDTFATATSSNIPSSESVKAYVDTEISGSVSVPDDTGSSDGDVLTTDGAGTYTWETPSGGGSSLPVDDTTSLVQDPSDNTKQVRLDAENVGTGTTAVLSVSGDNQVQSNLSIKGDGSGTSVFALYASDGSTLRAGMAYSAANARLQLTNSITTEALYFHDAGGAEFITDLTADSFIIDGGTSDDVLLGDGTTTSLAGIGSGTDDQTAAEVTSSATGNIAATNVDDAIAELESEKLASISASRTNEETYSNVIGQPYDDSVSDGAPPAGTLILEYEVPPAILGTGTTADMDDYMGYNTGTAGSGTSYTIQNVVEGGFSYFYVNAASEPTVSGTGITVEKFPNTTAFINNEDMYMCVWAVTDTLVHYWFVEKQ